MKKEQVLEDELQHSDLNDNAELTEKKQLCNQTILYTIKSSNKKIINQHSKIYLIPQSVIILYAHIQVLVHLYDCVYGPHKIADHILTGNLTRDSEYTLCMLVSMRL